jgi:hypothetical protein
MVTPSSGACRFRPALERLEDRLVPTVRYYGGAVLANVGVQGVFLGSGWSSDPGLAAQVGQLGTFLQSLTGSSFMDLMGRAGYGVGRGTYLGGWIDPVALPGSLPDGVIQAALAQGITDRSLAAPDANRLYFVYVEPRVVVTQGGQDSARNFYSYHYAFQGPTGAVVNYAVVPYPTAPNGPYQFPRRPHTSLSTFDTLTKVSSHELAESVTDPQGVPDPQGNLVGQPGWYDSTWRDPISHKRGGEIADIADSVIVDLNGYVIQGVAGRHDQPLIPAGGTLDPRFPHPHIRSHGRHHVAERLARAAPDVQQPGP